MVVLEWENKHCRKASDRKVSTQTALPSLSNPPSAGQPSELRGLKNKEPNTGIHSMLASSWKEPPPCSNSHTVFFKGTHSMAKDLPAPNCASVPRYHSHECSKGCVMQCAFSKQ